jgi:hypothetical protein
MIQINVNVTDSISPMLAEVISALSGSEAEDLNEAAGRAAVIAAIRYHREFDQAGAWKGKRYLGPGSNEGTSFGASVAAGWHFMSADKDGATIGNEADNYAFKVTGGTITPKKAKALTIPLVLEAKGFKSAEYQTRSGKRLFTIKGKNALFERIDQVVTGSRGKRGRPGATPIKRSGIRAVYALMKSVTMGPWPGAIPDEEEIQKAFAETYIEGIEDIISRS